MTGFGAGTGAHEAFFEHGPEMLLIASTRGAILRLNGASREVFGPQVTEGTPFLETVHPDDRDRVAAGWTGLAGAGEPLRCVCRLRIEDGSYQGFSLSALQAPGSEEVHGVLSPAASKASPAASRRALSLTRSSFAVIEHGIGLDVSDWNDGAERIFGYARAEVLGKSISALGIVDGELSGAWTAGLQSEGWARHEHEATAKDGRTFPCRWLSMTLPAEHDKPLRVLSVARQLTEPAASDAAHRQHSMLLRILLDKLPILAFRVDQRGAIVYQDGRGSEALGLDPGQLCGMSLFALYAGRPDDLARVQSALHGRSSHALSEIYGVPWESWYVPCPDDHGHISSMLAISLHIGDLKRAEQELSQKIVLAVEQQRMIRILSNIILEVWKGVLTLPVLGVMSGELAEQTMAALLAEVSRRRARHILVDLTGAGEVGAETAHHVLRLVHAVRLLGADGFITGIQPEVAHTMVSLDVDLSGIRTFANLREGLQFCMKASNVTKHPVVFNSGKS